MHMAKGTDLLVIMNNNVTKYLGNMEIDHRAIGVVYHPEFELGNYVPSKMPLRYDAFIFIDETKAMHPLYIQPDGHLIPKTYPFGM